MKCLVGLGNPTRQYAKTRHNVGFILLDVMVARKELEWETSEKFKAEVAKDAEYLYVKPLDYMNNSGPVLTKILEYYKIVPADLLVVHDDMDLQFGQVKLHKGRGSAGHKGVESIIAALGSSEFNRLRVGVGHPQVTIDPADYVLQNFSQEEFELISKIDLGAYTNLR